ncbi:hypothetical protein CRUP_031765 [Coryphaenoides rupestris]|nr:hypothetical protein CRUP_031765 [Coryphaenoides rupestris]
MWLTFLWPWLIGPLVLPEAEGCRVARGAACDKAPFVPGHNLAGEGFDVLERLPAAVLDWRPASRCSKQLSSALHHSVDSLLRSSSSTVNNNWGAGLSLEGVGRALLGGSRSDMAKFARSQHSADKATFALHEISCVYYSYRLADQPLLSTEFSKHLRRLPQSSGSPQDRALYRRLIDTYGTHYIHQVQLGGKVRRVTAFRTCLATLKGYTESEIKHCLNIELRMALGFLPANASFSNRCDNLFKGNMSMGFYQGFMTHKIEVIGGERYFPDILYNQDPSDSYHSWMNSLHDNPDVVSYAIFPLHHLVDDPQLAIHRATGLRADTFTKTDAYVKIFYDAVYEETATVMDDNDPVWNATYDFGSVSLGHQLHFEVWDRDVLYNDMAGRCVVFPERGTHALSCQLSRGVLYFSYTTACDPHLTGYRCGRYSPSAE